MQTCTDILYEYKEPKKCATHFRNTENVLGKGSYGTAYQACCEDDCIYVMKVINDIDGNQHIDNEVRIQNIAAAEDYALPVYETQKCTKDQREAFVMDRLDVSLYSDLFSLSDDQLQHMLRVYREVCAPYMDLIPHNHKYYSFLLREWSSMDNYTHTKQFTKFYLQLRNVFSLNLKYNFDSMKVEILVDSPAEKRRKLKYMLLALNLLDGLHQIGIHHNDTHGGNFMRKSDKEQYMMIDFGMATTTSEFESHNPDTDVFKKQLVDSVKNRKYYENEDGNYPTYPVYVDLDYLVEAFPVILDMATFEYNTHDFLQKEADKELDKLVQTFSFSTKQFRSPKKSPKKSLKKSLKKSPKKSPKKSLKKSSKKSPKQSQKCSNLKQSKKNVK